MRLSGKTVLVTGGGTGIGFAIARMLSVKGNRVAICGRRPDRLAAAKSRVPELRTFACDVSKEAERDSLVDWVRTGLNGIDMLVNNAGIQRSIDLSEGLEGLSSREDEIETNFRSQVRLSARFIQSLATRDEPAIVNVTSGLGFVPMARFPIYSATKAAMHSYTMSLRRQLSGKGIRVFEIIPPTVHDTELKGAPMGKSEWSVSAEEVASAAIAGMESDTYEIAIGSSRAWSSASRAELDDAFERINR